MANKLKQAPAPSTPGIGVPEVAEPAAIGFEKITPSGASPSPEALTPIPDPPAAETPAAAPGVPPHPQPKGRQARCGGRQPKAGDVVYYCQGEGTGLRQLPAMLIDPSRIDGHWHLNLQKLGSVSRRTDVPFSPEPRIGHWTWRD